MKCKYVTFTNSNGKEVRPSQHLKKAAYRKSLDSDTVLQTIPSHRLVDAIQIVGCKAIHLKGISMKWQKTKNKINIIICYDFGYSMIMNRTSSYRILRHKRYSLDCC